MKVLFVISDTGLGHRAVMDALVEEFKLKTGENLQYSVIDLLKYAGVFLTKDFPVLHTKMSQGGLLLLGYNLLFHLSKRKIGFMIMTILFRIHLMFKKKSIVELFKKEAPDLVVNINAYTNVIIQWCRLKEQFGFKYINVISDISNIHYSWILGRHDLCVVANEMAVSNLNRYRVSNTEILGYPLKRKFFLVKNQESQPIQKSSKLNLLIFGRNIQKTINSIDLILESGIPAKITVICGGNQEVKTALEKKYNSISIFGFTDNVHEIMHKSDLIISKAGPGNILEAVFLEKPLIITHYIGSQERHNIDFIVKNGLGYYCPGNKGLIQTINQIINKKDVQSSPSFHNQYQTDKIVERILTL